MKTPPSPNITTGPNRGSRSRPTTNSRLPRIMCSTSTPCRSPARRRAFPALVGGPDPGVVRTPKMTSPASVLCWISRESLSSPPDSPARGGARRRRAMYAAPAAPGCRRRRRTPFPRASSRAGRPAPRAASISARPGEAIAGCPSSSSDLSLSSIGTGQPSSHVGGHWVPLCHTAQHGCSPATRADAP